MTSKNLVTLAIVFVVATLGSTIVYSFFQTNGKTTPPSSSISNPTTSPDNNSSKSIKKDGYTTTEIAQHNSNTDCWVILNNEVLNVSEYLYQHPGGASAIIPFCGEDVTKLFNAQKKHTSFATSIAQNYKIGVLIK